MKTKTNNKKFLLPIELWECILLYTQHLKFTEHWTEKYPQQTTKQILCILYIFFHALHRWSTQYSDMQRFCQIKRHFYGQITHVLRIYPLLLFFIFALIVFLLLLNSNSHNVIILITDPFAHAIFVLFSFYFLK